MKFKRMNKIQKAVREEVDKLEEKELTRLIGECSRMTSTNCCWMEYGLRKIVTEIARAQIRYLKIRKKHGFKQSESDNAKTKG